MSFLSAATARHILGSFRLANQTAALQLSCRHRASRSAPAGIVPDLDLPREIPESKESQANAPHVAQFSLKNKTVAVTGAGRGLGITLAQAVLEAGGHVSCLDVLDQPAADAWSRLQRVAHEAELDLAYHKVDITDEAHVEQVFEDIGDRALKHKAPLYGTVACAGIQHKLDAIDYPATDFERILKVNVTGAFLTAKYSARVMIKNGTPGSIVLIASMSGQIANRGLRCTAYNSSKAAVQQMCRSVAQEWGPFGIRVNTLSPGYIRTAMTDELLAKEPELHKLWMAGSLLGRLGAPEDFKAPAIFLLTPGSSWMTGADLRVDGGHCATA